MPGLHIDQLRFARLGRRTVRDRVWREWCFLRAIVKRFRLRFFLMMAILFGGGGVFMLFSDADVPFPKAVFFTWSLVFGQPPTDFPDPPVLRALYFIVPILGLTVIIEAIVDFSLILRDRRRSERNWCVMMASTMSEHIVLVGLGKLGFRTFRLLRKMGEPIVVIERSPDCPFLDEVRADGAPLILGDARADTLLVEANMAAAKSVILATDDDLANLEVALDARRMNPGIRVVLRMFDQNMADKIRAGFNIHIAMSQSAIAAPAFATAAIDRSITNSFVVDDSLLVTQRWTVDRTGPFSGRTVGEVTRQLGLGVVQIRTPDGPTRLFPPPDQPIQPGDVVLVQGLFEELTRLRAKYQSTTR